MAEDNVCYRSLSYEEEEGCILGAHSGTFFNPSQTMWKKPEGQDEVEIGETYERRKEEVSRLSVVKAFPVFGTAKSTRGGRDDRRALLLTSTSLSRSRRRRRRPPSCRRSRRRRVLSQLPTSILYTGLLERRGPFFTV